MRKFTNVLLTALILLATIMVSCSAPESASLKDPIKIDTGLISGKVAGDKQDVRVYMGVPYAAPPIGNLRWKPPQPAASWQGVKECVEPGPAPLQWAIMGHPKATSEDCLYLNVWTPATQTTDKLPVMVWFYGGAFEFGDSASPYYDGTNIARHGVIMVTVNYRIGVPGYLAHPLLSKESEHNSSGNYGLLDQIAALQWVQNNIAAFGGDPNKVTIFGQSAGAISITCLMVSPLAKGLFQRAICESYADLGFFSNLKENKYGRESAENEGLRLAKDIGCDDLACLRSKSGAEIMKAGAPPMDLRAPGNIYVYGPTVDGWALPDLPINLFEAAKQSNIPLMIGCTADEWTLFQLLAPPTADAYKVWVTKNFGDYAQQILAKYPAPDDDVVQKSDQQMMKLYAFACPSKVFAGDMSKVDSKAYFYNFTRVAPGSPEVGAFHAIDIGYELGNMQPLLETPEPDKYFDKTDMALSNTMMTYWTNFAKTGDPNGTGLTTWPVYSGDTGQYMEFGDQTQVKSNLYTEDCPLLLKAAEYLRNR